MKVITTILPLLLLSTSSALADGRYTAAKQAAERVKRDEAELVRRVRSLSVEDRIKLKNKFRGRDSDRDGLSDIIEGGLGSNRCDGDSDDDGVDDANDRNELRRNDDDSRSGDDTRRGGTGLEVEVRGRITSLIDSSLTVGGRTFVLTATTVFRDPGFSKDDLLVGQCIEIEGRTNGSQIVAEKVHLEDSGC
jgi:Domain of unknown function (DUF5666)